MSNSTNYSKDTKSNIKVLTSLYVLITIVGITTNLAIIVAVMKTKALRRRPSLVLLNLVTCDFLQVIISAPYYLYSLNTYSVNDVEHPTKNVFLVSFCKGYLFFSYGLGHVSILTLLFISTDRYMAVVYPFFYQVRITRRKLIFFSFLCWLLPFLFCLPAIRWFDYDGQPSGFCGVQWSHVNFVFAIANVAILFVLPTCLIFYTNIRVYMISKRIQSHVFPVRTTTTIQRILQTHDPISSEANTTHFHENRIVISSKPTATKSEKPRSSSARDIRIEVSTLLLIGCFLLTWLPFVVPRLLITIGIKVPTIVRDYTPACAFSNVAFDPLIIFTCRTKIRKTVLKILSSCPWQQ